MKILSCVVLIKLVSSIVSLLLLFCITSISYGTPLKDIESCKPRDYFCQKAKELYRALDGQKIWNTTTIRELESLIEKAKFEGLNHERLRKKLNRISQNDELELTKLLIEISHQIYFGTVNPKRVYERWDFPRKEDKIVPYLTTLIKENRLSELYREFSPKHEGYVQLREHLRSLYTIEGKDRALKIQVRGKLELGTKDESITTIKRKLRLLGFYDSDDDSPLFDSKLSEAVKRFQVRHGLDGDGVIGKNTLNALNRSISARIMQVKLNLEKYRWLPENFGERYILVNIPSYELKLIEQGRIVLESPTIVGKNYKEDFRPTPLLYSKITQIVINPDWYVPQKIAAKDILPRIKKNPNYPLKDKIKIYHEGKEIDPLQVDWNQYSEENFPFKLVQKSGDRNALGRIKFHMPNSFDIYLHDTPDKKLFSKNRRAFSSGCIRVEKATELAQLLIKNNTKGWDEQKLKEALKTEKTYYINLISPIPVYILYFTNIVKNSELYFYEDLYGYDELLGKFLGMTN